MYGSTTIRPRPLRIHDLRRLDRLPQLGRLDARARLEMRAVAEVLPFRVNDYVLEELIRWDDVPDDPIFRLMFPAGEMLEPHDLQRMVRLVRRRAPLDARRAAAREIHARLNPHPAGQLGLNVARLDGRPVPGLQHKYRETVLFFPREGQTCHAYCAYCFRWPQLVGSDELRMAGGEADTLARYLRCHPEVTSVLITGGDPLVMRTAVLRRYLEPLLDPALESLASIRIGTKAATNWPNRILTDRDADDLMRLFEQVVAAGRHLALMAHVTHPRELEPAAARAAIARIRSTGAVVRCQAPVVRGVNDDPRVWAELWRREVALGAVPYYLFVQRDTGPRRYFEVPLARALDVFQGAYRAVSGLARTVRGPSMSTTAGKVAIDGVATIADERVFVLRFIQARNPAWVGRPFFAAFDPGATWFDELRPARCAAPSFFEPALPLVPPPPGSTADSDEAA